MKTLIVVLTSIGSLISIGFGIWHLFVPKLWNWYSHIDESARELILAVRAINIFFSVSLVFFGLINLIFLFRTSPDKFPLLVMLIFSSLLWGIRVTLQIIYPQGSLNPTLQYGMLSTFTFVLLCFIISLILLNIENNGSY